LMNYLPLLLPNLPKFGDTCQEIMSLIRKVGRKNPMEVVLLGIPEFDFQSDDNDIYDFRYDIEDENISASAMGSYTYLLFEHQFEKEYFPSVFSKTYIFSLLVPHMTGLLKHQNNRVFKQAVMWIMEEVMKMKEESFSGTRDPPHIDVRSFTNLLRALIDRMVRVDEKEFRAGMLQLFHKSLSLLKPMGRYKLLYALQVECPYPSFASEIMTRWRQEFLKALTLNIPDSPFLRPKIVEVFDLAFTQNEVNFLGNVDIVISALNFLRLMLLRGKHKYNDIDIWNEKMQERLKNKVELLLKQVIKLLDTETRDASSFERQKQAVRDIKKSGLPDLTVDDIDEAQKYNLNNLHMVYSHINLILEMMNPPAEDPK
jgi:hypothetical protein